MNNIDSQFVVVSVMYVKQVLLIIVAGLSSKFYRLTRTSMRQVQ